MTSLLWHLAVLWGALLPLISWTVGDRHIDTRKRLLGTAVGWWMLVSAQSEVPWTPWLMTSVAAMVAATLIVGAWRTWRFARQRRLDPGFAPQAAADLNAGALALLRSFERTGDVPALDDGIERLRRALPMSSGTAAHTVHAVNLVTALRGRYERLRRADDLHEAIRVGRAEFKTTSAPDPRRSALQAELSSALRIRHDHFGELADLEEAIEISRAALETAAKAERGRCLNALSRALQSRFDRTERLADLREAVERLDQAVLATRGVQRAMHRANLCDVLRILSRATGSLVELERAVTVGTKALKRVPVGRGVGGQCHHHLSLALRARYERRGGVPDLDAAIGHARQAVAAAPPDHPNTARFLNNLGIAVFRRFQITGDRGDLARALKVLREATSNPRIEVVFRVLSGLTWAEIAASSGEHTEAVTATEGVIELLPQLAARDLPRADQEHQLGRLSGVAGIAAACAIASDQPEKALVLLERGRGVLLSRALDIRTDLTTLRTRHPDLAHQFGRLRAELDARAFDASDRERLRRHRRALFDEWDALLERIRAQDGFAGFATMPDLDELLVHAEDGPIVFLNVTRFGSDAIMLTSSGVRTCPLPGATLDAVMDRVLEVLRVGSITDPHEQEPVVELLGWLWEVIAEPVLEALGMRPIAPGRPWPRVWWVATGLLSFLPIHAAGVRGSPGCSVLDRAISSYSPTARTLAAARARPRPTATRPLVVAMSSTPNAAPLPAAEAEAEVIRRLVPSSTVLTDAQATKRRVLAELPGRTWAHFACHAMTDLADPARSRLLLHDHEHHALTVNDIAELTLDGTELAYLDACETALSSADLTDEAIHLAAAFQLAGFPHVIASLWQVKDRVAHEFAADFYQQLTAANDPASAVHHATRAARRRYPNFPAMWAGHVHMGP